MKQIIYVTKKKVWLDGASFDWNEKKLTEVFKANREKIGSSDVRIVLGNDVSYLCAFPQKEGLNLTRESVALEAGNYLPIVIEDDTFDWSMVVMNKKVWIQAIAVDKQLLEFISRAVKENKINVNLMIPIGILLGQLSVEKKTPVLIRWTGQENLSVLAAGGLVDSVYADSSDEQIMSFAQNRWALDVSPEVVTVNDSNFNLNDMVFAEKNKGEDANILNIPMFKKLQPEKPDPILANAPQSDIVLGEAEKKPEPAKDRRLPLLVLVVIFILGCSFWIYRVSQKNINPVRVEQGVQTTPSPSPLASPSASISPSDYSVQVLNGSGVNGLAAKIRDSLTAEGFVNVEIGNSPDTEVGTIRSKATVPSMITETVISKISGNVIDKSDPLTEENDFDLVVVIGSRTK